MYYQEESGKCEVFMSLKSSIIKHIAVKENIKYYPNIIITYYVLYLETMEYIGTNIILNMAVRNERYIKRYKLIKQMWILFK